MNGRWTRTTAVVACAFAFAACDTGSPTAGIDRGGVRTPVTAEGPITGFGSIIVNGVHYDIDRATIVIDGQTASGADLALGQLVTVTGERDEAGTTGLASSVSLRTNVRGPVGAVNAAASELTVLGQRVLVGFDTVLALGSASPTLASIAVGDVVAVSGFVGGGGLIDATRIERAAAGTEVAVLGIVMGLDASARRFSIGSLAVDYGSAVLIEDFPSGAPRLGDRVFVKGVMSSSGSMLLARELHFAEEAEEEQQPGGEVEVEGLISRFVSPADFDVAGRAARASSTTVYEDGSAASLALNVRVELEGTIDSLGVIVARKIEIENSGRIVGDGGAEEDDD
jgi:hypothetical protein